MQYLTRYIVCLLCFLSFSGYVEAQFGAASGPLPSSSIVAEPRYPEPGETVTLRLNDFSLNTTGASYQWYVNGTLITSAANLRTITLTAPALGASIDVRAVTTLGGGATVEANTTISSTRVDLLVEADTLVPVFYQGRPLPSSGSNIRVTALPFLGGESTNPGEYAYTWKVNGKVVDGGSRAGMNSTVFSVGFGRNVEITVDIANRNGTLLVSKTTFIPIAKPELYFYTIDPLQGILEIAHQDQSIFTGEEMLLRAEPYYVDRTLLVGNVLTEWKLNNRTITNPNSDPQEVILRRSGDHGTFRIGFHIRNLNQLLQGVEGDIVLRF